MIINDHYQMYIRIATDLEQYVQRKDCLDQQFLNMNRQFNELFDCLDRLNNQEMEEENILDDCDDDWDWDQPESSSAYNKRVYHTTFLALQRSYKVFNETNDLLDQINNCKFQKELISNLILIDFGDTGWENQFNDLYNILKLLIEKNITTLKQLTNLRIYYKSGYDDWATGPFYHLDGLSRPARMFLRVIHGVIKFKVLDAGHMKAIYYGINGWTENREKFISILNKCNNNRFLRKS